ARAERARRRGPREGGAGARRAALTPARAWHLASLGCGPLRAHLASAAVPDARLLAPVALAAALAACGGAQQQGTLSYSESARRDYERALAAFEDDDCLTATPLLQNVRSQYPYSRYAALAELRLA